MTPDSSQADIPTREAQGPAARYARDLRREGFEHDSEQQQAVDALDALYHELLNRPRQSTPQKRSGWLDGLLGRQPSTVKPVTGLYLWGKVGRGKTYLMDAFFESLPFRDKQRTHFYRFMQSVHAARSRFRDRRDPLDKIGAELASQARLLCFDEFFVTDIADAMILGGVLRALFARGVTLVATSNVAPDDLYRDGLQRVRFLPAIEKLKRHVRVLELGGQNDFRLRALEREKVFITDDAATAQTRLQAIFERVAGVDGKPNGTLKIQGRNIACRRAAEDVVWFDFEALVGGPRSAADYIEIARMFNTVLVSDLPCLDRYHENDARRFISLVDEFYDRGVNLVISAEAPIDEIYKGRRLRAEFERTRSRLHEMQSREYLALPHLCQEPAGLR